MRYTLSLTQPAAHTLEAHLLRDRSREQMAITLCGVNQLPGELRLLARDVILLPPDAFRRQTSVSLEVKPEVEQLVHQRAAQRGLVQVDWHSHPGDAPAVTFSATDDHYEAELATYLAARLHGIPYGSVVVNGSALDARLWVQRAPRRRPDAPAQRGARRSVDHVPCPYPLQSVLLGDLQRRVPTSARSIEGSVDDFVSPIHDRQVRAFGQALQHKLARLRVGIIGLGGLGSQVLDHLARLGVAHWVLVDPDHVELSNLNRLVNASVADAQRARLKVDVARRIARQSSPHASIRTLPCAVFDPLALCVLKRCDLLIVATDNHASRMAANRLAVQYLIPLLHVGFNISVTPERQISDVSGEYALPELGNWCLQCAGIIDPQQAGWELASEAQRAILRQRGYVADTPAPAVRHLDGVVASLAAAEVHNLVQGFKPLQRYLVYDALKSELLPLRVTPSHACPVCSPDSGVLGLGDLEPLPDYARGRQVALPAVQAEAVDATEMDAECASCRAEVIE